MALGGGVAGVARVIIEADNRRLQSGLRQSERDVQGFATKARSSLGLLGSSLAGGALVGGGLFLLGKAFHSAFDEMQQMQKVAAQTNAVIKSTGSIAGVTARGVDELAQSLLRKSGVDDEVIKSGENMLLTFTNIRNVSGDGNDIFDQATKTLLDMSVALGEDVPNAAIRLGKALQDPILGVTSLRRVGVALDGAQRAQIKTMVEAGNVMGAQKLILAELTKEFGGSAEAAGKTLPGQLNILRETMRNTGAQILTALSPAITQVAKKLLEWTRQLQANKQLQQDVKDTVQDVAGAIRTTVKVIDEIVQVMGGWKTASEFIIAGVLVSKVRALTAAFTALAGSEVVAGGAMGTAGATVGIGGAAARAAGLLKSLRTIAAIGTIVVAFKIKTEGWDAIPKWLIPPGTFGRPYGPKDKLPPWAVPTPGAGLGAQTGAGIGAAAALQAGVVSTARRYGPSSGITYTWGGFKPETGFDCSGYLYYVYAQHGIHIPRDTRGQWRDPNAIHVPPGAERNGDGVYFVGSLGGANAGPPPGHVGIYIGGGKFIEYFSSGKPARISDLGSRRDYMGARRWIKIVSGGAGAPSGRPGPDPSLSAGADTAGGAAAPTYRAKKATAAGVVPANLQLALAEAEVTKGTADDLKALRAIEAYLEKRLSSEKNVTKRLKLLAELKSVRSQIETAGGRARKGLTDLIPENLQHRLASAELTKTLDDDLKALQAIEEYLVKRLERTKKLTEQTRIMRELRDVRSQMEGILGSIGADKKAIDKLIGDIVAGTDTLVQGPPSRPAVAFAPGTDYQAQVTTTEGKTALTKLLASLEPQKQTIRTWAKEMKLKRDAAVERKKTLQKNLKKLMQTPVRLQQSTTFKQAKATLQEGIAILTQTIKDLDAGINRAFEMWADIEATETSEVQKLAEEDAQRSSQPPDTSGGGGGDFGGGDTGGVAQRSAAELQAEVDRNVVGFLTGTRDLTRGYATNVLAAAFAGQLGANVPIMGALGGSVLNITNIYPTPPEDPHLYSKQLEFEVKALVA